MKSASRLETILRSGNFAVTGELGPPKNSDPEVVRKKAKILKGYVDAVNITDCQTAIVRMSSIAAGLITLSEGVEPVIQMTCRDRNRIGMQSDILGASALGLKNLLCLTGDHQKFGNHPGAKGVFDMDSIQLLGMMKDLRDEKKFQCGEVINGLQPELFLGAAANPFAGPPEFRAVRMGKKIDNGADFIQTQIVYNVEKFAQFMQTSRELGLHEKAFILAGVTPPKSLGMARYMKKFVPGMDVPDEIIARMKDAKDKEDEGINICVDIINQVREIKGVSGVHVMAIEWESAVPEILTRAGLAKRPSVDVEIPPGAAVRETITVSPTPAVEGTAQSDAILSAAQAEAEKIILEARQKALQMTAAADTRQTTIEDQDFGEDEMNEKERQMALESVRLGLDALKKTFGLSDDQFDALANFAKAAAVLNKEPESVSASAKTRTAAPQTPAPPVPASPVTAPTPDDAQKEAERKAAADAQKQAEEKAAADKAAAEAKAAEEAKKEAAAQAQKAAAEEAKKAAEAKAAEEAKAAAQAKKEKAAQAPAEKSAAPQSETQETLLEIEKTPLSARCTKIPEDHYKKTYSGKIRETVLGSGENTVIVGGTNTLPFQLFEGDMPRKPAIAMEIIDIKPEEWPETLSRHFSDVSDNPVAWAQKCVKQYNAESICFSLVSTDPNGVNRPSAEAAKDAAAVVNAVDVPVIIWGCGNSEKDTETLREITSIIGDKKVCLAPLSDANYRAIGATAMAFQHPIVAASPIDVNLAKQLNILLENLGVSLGSVLMDPSIGALGYGIEYTYSVMERIRIAALSQQDEKLQVPFICNLGREVWKAKECRLPSDDLLGDQENRGIMMEALTASCMILCGGDLLIMRHPRSISLTKSLINGLVG